MKNNKNEFESVYNLDVQKILLSCLIEDPDVYIRCRSIIKDEYFDDQIQRAVRFILKHTDEAKQLPNPRLIQAKTGIEIAKLSEYGETLNQDWFLGEIEKFCRYKALENIILTGYDLLQKGEEANIESRVKEAMQISLVSDLGTIYFENPEERLKRMMDKSNLISTGWSSLDAKLFGGFTKGGLNIFSANSGVGKSITLQNLAVNWALAGEIVIYFTIEMAADKVALRMDSMFTGKKTKEIFQTVKDTSFEIQMKAKNAGKIYIKKMPDAGTTVNDLRAYVKEFEIKTGTKPTRILVDYLDIMAPINKSVDSANLFVKDQHVSTELRAFMDETKTAGATASQMTRGSIEVQGEYDQSHSAGGISKVNTCDNYIAIYAPANMKLKGEWEFIFLKTRDADSVGHKLKMRYNPGSMRISDIEMGIDIEYPKAIEELQREYAEQKNVIESKPKDDNIDKILKMSINAKKKRNNE